MKMLMRFFFKKLTMLLIAASLMLISPVSILAKPTSSVITPGTTWLLFARYDMGIWELSAPPDPAQTEFTADDCTKTYIRDSHESVIALQTLGTTTSEYKAALDWVALVNFPVASQLCQKIRILSTAGMDTSQSTTTLLGYRNADNGFGGAKGYKLSNNLDTSLALQALKTANYSDATVLYQAINFLTTNQNADGGWGFIPSTSSGQAQNDPSNVYVTAIVLRALSGYSSQFNVQSSISKAAAFLLAKQTQNNDGGFGSSPSTVYETALSVISLIESGQGSTQQLQSAVTYLISAQSTTNGSWNDDPYSTALALQALALARPNLIISSLSLSKPMPQENETIAITANVNNIGLDNSSNVIVRFYLGDPAAGGTQIGNDQVIPSLVVGGVAQAAITASFTGTGGKTIFVIVDPDGLIPETSKADNRASARLWVATGPDLAVYSEELIPATYVPASGTAFTLTYTVRNLGESSTNGFDVALYDGQPSGIPLQTAHISGLNGTEVRTGTLGLTLTTNGNHTLYLVADSGNVITEISKTNNTGSVTVNVGGIQTLADLAVAAQDIILTPSRPHAGDTVTISANVHNIGADAANNFTFEIFDGQPEAGGTLICSQTISLVAGGSQVVSTNWPIPAGIHNIVVVLDRTNQIVETNESNNRVSVRVMTDMVDITLSATDLTFNPAHPVSGDSVVFSITAHNNGIKQTGAFNLALYNGDPSTGGTLLQTYPIANINGDGSTTVTDTFIASPQTFRFYVVADRENIVTEMYEDNNTAIRSLKIKAPGEVLGPDLVPIKIDLTDTTTNPQTLAISGSAHVTFQNKGDYKIITPFNVIIFEDRDSDGRYTQGVDNILSTATNTLTIWPEGAGLVNPTLSGTVQFLHSPLYAYVDSGDAILEQDETNNLMVSCKDCEVVPSNPIQPVAKWTKADGYHTGGLSVIANLNGKNSPTSAPAIIYVTPWVPPYSVSQLFAIDGQTGNTLFTVKPSSSIISQEGLLAVGDIDGDGLPEIVVPKQGMYGKGLLAYSNTGILKWDNTAQVAAWDSTHWPYQITIHEGSAPVIVDIDGDGIPEIIDGATVINNDGSIRWVGSDAYATYGKGQYFYGGYFSIVADLDLDGKQEIIGGHTAYNSNGTIKWNANLPDGMNAIGNFDGDPYPEIVLVTTTSPTKSVYLLEHDGTIKWGPVNVDFFWGPPVVADFDGDGESEIGIRTQNAYLILDKNGNLKNTLNTPYNPAAIGGSIHAAPAVFDLNGDGRPEVLFNSDYYFRIFDGKTGTLLYQESFKSASVYQGVIIADVDNDGHAEAVLTGDGSNGSIRVYGSASHDWVGARGIWNQLSYHVTNVNDDGTIPQYESPSWLLNKTYRTQSAIGQNPNPYLTPNLTASYLRIEQAGMSTNLAVRVGNGGAIASGPTVTVTFYDGNPSSGDTIIGTASTTRALSPGDYQDVIYSWSGGSLGLHHIYAVIDAANVVSECRKDDNQVNADFTIQAEYADLKIGQEDIVLPAGPYYEGIPVSITANVKNIGALPASNILVRMYNSNPAAGGIQLGVDQTITNMNAGSTVPVMFTYDTLGKSGANIFYVVVDPANTVSESSKANNMASVTLTVQPPVLPDLAVSAADIQLTPASPREGDNVTITATIRNLGTALGNIPVRVSVRSGEFGVGSEVYSETRTIYPILNLGQTATVTTTFYTTGLAGQQSVVVTIDPANAVTESREDNNSAFKSFFVQSSGLNASITLDKTSYQADDIVTATTTGVDTTGSARALTLGLYVQDSAGNRIATISIADPLATGPNGSVIISRTWNTGATLSGQYTLISELAESGQVISRKSAGFTILPDTRVNAAVTTDKISYNPNETAALTAVATSQSRNYIFENLSAKLTIGSGVQGPGSSAIYSDTKTITTLMPGATFTFKDYWNTGTHAPGAYPVLLEVRDASGALISTGTATVTITNVIKPSVVLKGTISVDRQSLLSGETATVSYSVMNNGNIDLSNVTLSILTVHVVNETVYDTFSSQAILSIGATYAHTAVVDTANYTAKDYLVILRANIGGTEETLAGTYFRVEGAPTAPSLASPAMNADVETLTPTLSVNNASDPNDDKLTYEFEVYGDSGLTQQVLSGVRSEESGVTSWIVPNTLTENATYYWRSRAYDNRLYGDWMAPASFRVNTANDPPTAPTVSSPTDNGVVDTLVPVLVVNNASDPDSPSLTYNFEVALDPDFISIVSTTIGVTRGPSTGSGGSTSWQIPLSLMENTTYYWRCQADDWLITGPWMTPAAKFFVNTANDAPSKPAVMAPLNNSEVTTLSPDIVIINSTDPDSAVLTYFFEVDIVPTFDSSNIIRSGSISAGQGTTMWQVTGLQDNTQYYVHAKANDGQTDGPWSNDSSSNVHSFFVNTANDPPTAPALANPSNGAGVNTDTPTLSVHNATDPDRDVLTYDFEVYADAALTTTVTATSGVRSQESGEITSWTIPVTLTENQTYYWRARASDGQATSLWMPTAFFMINKANDAPEAPALSSPVDGSSVATLTPTLAVTNAVDPDSDVLTYDFEVYAGSALVQAISGIAEGAFGITSVTLNTALTDNTVYQWRARANDGDRYGPWMGMAAFTTHVAQASIHVDIDFEPETLNKWSNGTWVKVEIELPHGYNARDIDISSIRLEGTVHAEPWPYECGEHHHDNGCDHDHHGHSHSELTVKFKRSDVIAVLPGGNHVPVHVTGSIGNVTFEGVDIIRVMP